MEMLRLNGAHRVTCSKKNMCEIVYCRLFFESCVCQMRPLLRQNVDDSNDPIVHYNNYKDHGILGM